MADAVRTIEIEVNTKEAVENLDKLNESLDENQQENKESQDAAKKYEKQLDSSAKATSIMTDQLDKMTGGLFSSAKGIVNNAKAFKTFNTVLKASPIGLILAAVGALAAAFTRLQGPADKAGQLFRGLESVMNTILDRIALLGGAVIKLFSGDFKGAVQDAKSAFDDLGGAIQESFERGEDIARQTQELERLESDVALAIAKRRLEIEKLVGQSRDQTNTEKERLEFVKQAAAIEQQNLNDLLALNQKRLDLAAQELADSSNLREDQIAFQQAQVQALQTETQLRARQRELTNRVTEATNAYNRSIQTTNDGLTEQTSIYQGLSAELQEYLRLQGLLNDELEEELELQEDLEEIESKRQDTRKKGAETATDATKEATTEQEKLNQAFQLTAASAGGLLDIFQGKVGGKDIFKTVLRTLSGVLAILVPGAGPALGAFGSIASGLFADGGVINGPSHAGGGVWINAEGGEGVINKRSMRIPWVRSLASELNQLGGGVKFADGGVVPTPTGQDAALARISNELSQQQIVLPIEDLRTVNTKVTVLEDRSEF